MTTTSQESGLSRKLPGDRRALVAVGAMFFNNGVVYASWAPRIPELRDQVNVSVGTLGLILGFAGAVGLVGSWLSSFSVDRFGSRWITVICGVILSATLALAGATTSALVLALALAILSATDVLVDVGMNLQGAQISARRTRPVMNRLHALWSVGTVLGSLLAFRISGAGISLRTHLGVVAVVMVANVCIAAFGLLRRDDPLVEGTPGNGNADLSNVGALALLTSLGFLAISVEIIPSDWSALRLTDDLGATPSTASLAFVAFVSGMTTGRLFGDFVVHWIGDRIVLLAAAALSAFGLALATLGPNVTTALIGFVIAGLGGSVIFPQIYARAAQTPGVNPGRGLAFMTVGQRSATLMVPLVVGILANSPSISVGQAVAIMAIPAATGLLLISILSPATNET